MRKRGLAILMSCLFVLTVGLTACGGNDGPTIAREGGYTGKEGDTKAVPSLFGEGEGTIENIGPFTLVDDDRVTLTLVSKEVDSYGDVGFNVEIVNKGDRAIYVTGKEESFVIDGKVIQPVGGAMVQAGESGSVYLWFDHRGFGNDALTDLEGATGAVAVLDDETFEEIGVYSFAL